MDRSTGIRTYNRLLFRVGIIFFTTLILSIFGAGVHSYYLVMKAEQEEALEMAEDIGELANIGEKEDTRQWILDYWESHYDEMDYLSPEVFSDREKMEAWSDSHQEVVQRYIDRYDTVTADDLNRMDKNEQETPG